MPTDEEILRATGMRSVKSDELVKDEMAMAALAISVMDGTCVEYRCHGCRDVMFLPKKGVPPACISCGGPTEQTDELFGKLMGNLR